VDPAADLEVQSKSGAIYESGAEIFKPSSMKLPYQEGSIFVLPIRTGGYARGVVARKAPRGKVLFGYFFGPLLSSVRSAPVDGLNPSQATFRVRFGDLGLINGEWKVIGSIRDWNRAEWLMPAFIRKDPLGKRKSLVVTYSDTDPLRIESERPFDDDSGLDSDTLYGYGAVEIVLTKLLKAKI
jgi:Immunity protein 26